MFKTVPAESYAGAGEPSDIAREAWLNLDQEKDPFRLIARLGKFVAAVAPMGVAAFIPGKAPRILHAEGFVADRLTELRQQIEACPNLTHEVSRNATPRPRRFSDGTSFYLLPLARKGLLEGILCLHDIVEDRGNTAGALFNQLQPLCLAAATALAGIREAGGDQPDFSSAEFASGDLSSARGVIAGRLLGNIAHDIRTPATVVRGYLRMLLDGRVGPIDPAQRECLELAASGAAKLAALGAQVEEAANVFASLAAQRLDLRDLWSEASRAFRREALTRAITLNETIPAERVPVCGDREAITCLIEQLLSQFDNAECNGEMRVAISMETMGATLKLSLPRGVSAEHPGENPPGTRFENLRHRTFIYGGTLLCSERQGESTTVTLLLPGGRA
jgi:signal transduction histidine kinase